MTLKRPKRGPRQPGEPELFGPLEAAAEYGVTQSNLRQVSGLPEPYDRVAAAPLWRADEIRVHAAERRKRLGRT